MPTATCPACHKTLEVDIKLAGAPPEGSTGVAIVCLHCAVPSVILGNGELALVDMSKLDSESRQELQAAIDEAKRQAASKFRDWVSILSANEDLPVEMLPSLVPSGAVPVYLMPQSHTPVGRALEYEVRGDSIWALLELETTADFSRATSFLRDGKHIIAIAVTNVPRETLNRMGHEFKKRRPAN